MDMKNNWTAILTLGISASWIYLSATAHAKQEIETELASVDVPNSLSSTRWDSGSGGHQVLAQLIQNPQLSAITQQFGDVIFHGDWRVTKSSEKLDAVGNVIVLAAPGAFQIDLTNANVLKNYRLRARIETYDKLFDPQQIKECWMNFNPTSPDPVCILDRVRPVRVVMYAKWLPGPKPKGVFNKNSGTSVARDPFSDYPSDLYYMNGDSRPLHTIIKNARRAKFEFPATPKPKEEDTRRCWRGITGVVSCW
jgi:hypothetical protein